MPAVRHAPTTEGTDLSLLDQVKGLNDVNWAWKYVKYKGNNIFHMNQQLDWIVRFITKEHTF